MSSQEFDLSESQETIGFNKTEAEETLVFSLATAADDGRWEEAQKIALLFRTEDEEILPILEVWSQDWGKGDDDSDDHTNIKEAVMMAWRWVQPKKPDFKELHFKRALEIMNTDERSRIALRAAVTVLLYRGDPVYGEEAGKSLAALKEKMGQGKGKEREDWEWALGWISREEPILRELV